MMNHIIRRKMNYIKQIVYKTKRRNSNNVIIVITIIILLITMNKYRNTLGTVQSKNLPGLKTPQPNAVQKAAV